MKINQLKAGVVLSYATQAVHILTGLLYTPIMLRLLGQNEYGLYQLVSSVVSYLSLLSLGFGSSYMRFYSRYKAKDDMLGVARLNGMFMTIFLVIATICLLCGGVMTVKADIIFGSGLTAEELTKSRVLMAMMVFNMALSFVGSVFSSNITAHEKFFFQRIVEFLRALFNPFLTLPLLLLGYGSIGMVAISSFLAVFSFCMNAGYSLKKLKMKFSFRAFDFKLLKEMWVFTFFIFINMIVDQINWSVDKFLLGRMMGTTAVALYGVAGQLNSLYNSMSVVVSSVFIPKVNIMVATENNSNKLTELFIKVGRLQFIVVFFIISIYTIFGKRFVILWAGQEYINSYYVGLLLMIPMTIPLIQNIGIEIRRAQNKHIIPSIFMLFITILNLIISIPLIYICGEIGAALGTAIALCINTIFINIYYRKVCKLDIVYFWKQIVKFIPGCIFPIAIGVLLNYLSLRYNIVIYFTCIFIYAISYIVSMWCLSLNNSEKNFLLGFIRRSKHDRN